MMFSFDTEIAHIEEDKNKNAKKRGSTNNASK